MPPTRRAIIPTARVSSHWELPTESRQEDSHSMSARAFGEFRLLHRCVPPFSDLQTGWTQLPASTSLVCLALQRFRIEYPYERHLVTAASYLVDYPFANRLYPGALDVLEKLLTWGQTVILSDGDVVFQPRKVYRSGIFEAVNGQVLIYVHKEEALADVERRYPADHYVMVDDKLRILAALKKAWGDRVTTVFPRQGKFANDPKLLAAFPDSADVSVARISDLLDYSLADLLKATSLRNPK